MVFQLGQIYARKRTNRKNSKKMHEIMIFEEKTAVHFFGLYYILLILPSKCDNVREKDQ
jgi:hypothetical protein